MFTNILHENVQFASYGVKLKQRTLSESKQVPSGKISLHIYPSAADRLIQFQNWLHLSSILNKRFSFLNIRNKRNKEDRCIVKPRCKPLKTAFLVIWLLYNAASTSQMRQH